MKLIMLAQALLLSAILEKSSADLEICEKSEKSGKSGGKSGDMIPIPPLHIFRDLNGTELQPFPNSCQFTICLTTGVHPNRLSTPAPQFFSASILFSATSAHTPFADYISQFANI